MNYNNLPSMPQPQATQAVPQQSEWALSTYMSQVMRKVYVKMFLGLLVTALTSYIVLTNQTILMTLLQSRALLIGLCVGELALVFALSMAINKLNPVVATIMFYAYAVLNGVTLTPIFLVYTMSSIALTFFVTAGVFLAMSIYGYTTKSDLTKFGTYMVMALIGLIVCSIINIFWANSVMDWIISFAGVAIFVGLTAWDTQKIKQMAQETDEVNAGKLATIGALSLYLDFINLFLYLLRFLGNRN
ncbi:MAG: Bax inhibitor-1/YccA family protein [Bacteroidales bacterium]|nr:Bax inhibitor-1/YccA family protein [Bacteroidales bacterium]MDY6413014.1 Bax inhibitor-1/YccA family protein [Bacteroidales bacterium]